MGLDSALAQKYRPLLFRDVLDQESIITVLKNILRKKNFFVPLMFTGNYGSGKTTLARIFARTILCKNVSEDGEPCNECSSCKSFIEGTNLSFTEIDAASNSGVDQIRKLRDEANLKVLGESDIKVTLIDECHSITNQGNEALLKQLEEGSEKQVYIFCTTAPEKMLDTVRSRCFEFSLNKIKPNSIATRLKQISEKENIEFEEEAIEVIAQECSPHVRDSIKNLDYLSNFGVITKDIVFEHFNLNLNTKYLEVILNLKENLSKSLEIIQEIVCRTNILDIYEGLIKNLINIQKLKIGMDVFKNENQVKIAEKIQKKLGDSVSDVLEELLKRNRYSDLITLESDIILLNKKLLSSFSNNVVKVVEKNSNSVEDTEESKSKEEDISDKNNTIEEEKNNIENFEKTSEVLKRYKSYPQELALMMDRGKKSSSLKNNKTVELNQAVKDFKKNLDTDELKNYINNKRLVT